jgi:hypothetical protein
MNILLQAFFLLAMKDEQVDSICILDCKARIHCFRRACWLLKFLLDLISRPLTSLARLTQTDAKILPPQPVYANATHRKACSAKI